MNKIFDMMNKIFDMIAQWSGLGQAIFFLIVLSTLSGTVISVSKHLAICVRGWPPYEKSIEPVQDED